MILLFSVFYGTLDGAVISSRFDSDLEGWTTNDSGSFSQVATGGNPGGFLWLDNSELSIAQIQAPTKFLGDLSAYIGGKISFDGNLLGRGGNFFNGPDHGYLDFGYVRISSPTIAVQIDLSPNGVTAPYQEWQTYSAVLDGDTWGVSDTDFGILMADVTAVSIVVESLFGSEVQGVDNVEITTVPEPSTCMLLVIFLIGALTGRSR